MKNRLCTLLLIIYLFPSFLSGQTPPILDAEIKRVEQGLLPPVLIKGEPGWTIEDRLKFYRAPGVSVAVIKDFNVIFSSLHSRRGRYAKGVPYISPGRF